MEFPPIKTESDYQNALTKIERLFDAEPLSPELERLDILTTLVEIYEQQHYPIDVPDPIQVLKDKCDKLRLPSVREAAN